MVDLTQRRSFDTHLPLGEQVIGVPSVRGMSLVHLRAMVDAFNRYGFVILECEDQTDGRDDLLALKWYLGNAAPHPRADEDGVVPISNARTVAGFLGSSSRAHLPHTDGAFRDVPEKITTLQCVVQPAVPGLSVLCSAKAAYDHLATMFPDRLHLLEREDALTVTRTTQSSTQGVFRTDGHAYFIKFRMSDGAAEVVPHPEVREMFEELCRFFRAKENRLVFALRPGQILIGDNTAIVHGRTPFPSEEVREMRRLNFDGSGPLCVRMGFGFVPRIWSPEAIVSQARCA
jgi:alpha-ketoglutarate-dependent taurine dioxygenase